jgi:hypothetical protein
MRNFRHFQTELESLMLIVSVACVVYALVLLISTSLSFAFSSQIARREKRNQEWSPGAVIGGGGGGGDSDHDVGGISNQNIIMDDYAAGH